MVKVQRHPKKEIEEALELAGGYVVTTDVGKKAWIHSRCTIAKRQERPRRTGELVDVDNLGHRGDEVEVAHGCGRNYLLPRKLALQANEINKAAIEQLKASANITA